MPPKTHVFAATESPSTCRESFLALSAGMAPLAQGGPWAHAPGTTALPQCANKTRGRDRVGKRGSGKNAPARRRWQHTGVATMICATMAAQAEDAGRQGTAPTAAIGPTRASAAQISPMVMVQRSARTAPMNVLGVSFSTTIQRSVPVCRSLPVHLRRIPGKGDVASSASRRHGTTTTTTTSRMTPPPQPAA